MPDLVHATAIAVAGRAVLLRGPSGAGKSDLALRLIGGHWRLPGLAGEVLLVADDQVSLVVVGRELMVRAPEAIAGRLEIRGVGIFTLPYAREARLAAIVDLVRPEAVPRLPEPASEVILGIAVRRHLLDAFSASAPLKVLTALSISG